MNEIWWLIFSIGLVIVFIFVHEFIHWVTLKAFGYSSKLIWKTKGIWIFPGIGIKPIGIKENIVCAKEMYVVVLMPMMFGWIWFIPLIFPRFTYLDMVFGFVIWFVASSSDLKNAIDINRWWLKPHKIKILN